MDPTTQLEQEARRLRDAVYGVPISDKSWGVIQHKWVEDIAWIRRTAAKGTSQ